MYRNLRTTLHAFVLPLALFALLQGGSCREKARGKDSAGRGGNVESVAAVNAAASPGSPGNPASPVSAGSAANVNRAAGKAERRPDDSTAKTDGQARSVAAGQWGGPHVNLDVNEEGAGLEFDCAHGRFSGKLTTDAGGNFDIAGTFFPERGGPVRVGEESEGQPARYSGKVEGKTMTLKVVLTASGDEVGTFTLAHGKEGRLVKCR